MERIASFCVDHNKLLPGIYTSRVDGDIVTYDIRMRRPNIPPFLPNPVLHTIEHLFATFARNSELKDRVIYFGPMGCRTGFYLLLRNTKPSEAIRLIVDTFQKISEYEGPIPGAAASECGNYLEHDLSGTVQEVKAFLPVIENWTVEKLNYNF
ncbi:S-ribosylhomocysteine lyase [Caprobacter fermentans]|uniref:S-ribosylhomocysteine lyase n=1 Tax=Caproicibacter fermentans TaxID=2576756 RepID=A0A6N8I5W8_9FIRM|nr:S-ribosylhomocysteine lyase [Caproicibacter fermentans]MVB12970.1 S-ribosylhomocysteine lyase [Caproicibacter fermentans]OCN02493.1 S-ribosylhomocysteinase [Clostridium sp. W14A]QNK41239.1 S-ribosylhomocysteine lyase [Caproicibacter fermentans]